MKKAMKRLVGIAIIVLALFVNPKSALAGCQVASGGSCQSGAYERNFTLEFLNDPGGGGTNHSIDPQCTNPIGANGTPYTVCCDTLMEANSFDSVRAPLCGSSIEKGVDNSVCWGCGGYIYCSGADFTLAGTDPILDQYRQEGFRVLTQNEMSALRAHAASQGRPERFIFNGIDYPLTQNISEIGICSANLTACLVPSQIECINLATQNNRRPTLNESGTVAPAPRRESDPSWRFGSRQSGSGAEHAPNRTGKGGNQMTILADPGINPGQPLTGSQPLNFLQKITDTHQLFSRIRYGIIEGQTDLFESFPLLGRFGPIFEESGLDLMPSVPQKAFSPPDEGDKAGMYPLPGMAGYRFCAPGGKIEENDGKDNIPLAGVSATKGNIGTKEHPRFWAQLTWATQYFASITTRARTEGTDFITPSGPMVDYDRIVEEDGTIFLKADPKELDRVLFGCGAGTEGTQLSRLEKDAEGVARTGGKSGGIFSSIKAVFDRAFFANALRVCNDKDERKECTDAPLYILPTDSIAALPAVTSQTLGVADGQLSSEMPKGKRCKIINGGGGDCEQENPEGQKGGLVRSFLSSRFVKNIDYINAQTPQRQTLSIPGGGGNNVPRDAYPRWMRSMIDGLSCVVDNAVIPSKLKKNGARCRFSQGEREPYPGTPDRGVAAWTPATSIPVDFTADSLQTSVKEAIEQATKDTIPQCVLEGVKFIESGPEWIGGRTCLINECSAAGPFAITVGQDASGDTHCSQCGESWKDGSRTCPDAWEYDWPSDTQSNNPCNLQLSAEKAVDILIAKSQYWTETMGLGHTLDTSDPAGQKEGIILAGNSYVGSSQTWERLGGCSYGEFVYKHCNPSYVCGSGGNIEF